MREDVDYKELVVNPENYRFDLVDTEEQAIDLMLEKKGIEILNLAKDILKNGLDGARDFRVLKKDSGYLVLDGNRRATALKCLHDTSLIKDKVLKDEFEKLNIKNFNLPDKVKVFIYSSEEDASKWIKLDHTGKNNGVGQDSWDSVEIDRFRYKFEGKLSPAAQALAMIEKEKGKKLDTKKIKISTINRIFSNPESRSYLGIDIKDKKIVFTSSKEEAIERLDSLFDLILQKDIKVDQVYTKEKALDFVKQLFGSKPREKQLQILPIIPPVPSVQIPKMIRKTPRTFGGEAVIFGRPLSLLEGSTNDLYRDIIDLFKFYQDNKDTLSPGFPSLIRMSLRLIVESASSTDKHMDAYIENNFDAGKSNLSKDQKTTLSIHSIEKDTMARLLHVGAHNYSSSANIDQAIAMSVIIGEMLAITHSKK